MTDRTRLGDLASRGVIYLNDGYRTKASEPGSDGIPILRVSEVMNGSIRPTFKDRVRPEFRAKIGSKVSRPCDVIVATKGTVGRAAIVPPLSPEFAYSPQLCFLRVVDADLIDPQWLYSWIRSPEFQLQAQVVAGQTDMAPYVNLVDLRRMTINVPTISEQRAIAEVLGALDAKIDANRRLVPMLRELATALLHWATDPESTYVVGDVADVRKGLSYTGAGLADDGMPMVNLANAENFGWLKRSGFKHYTGTFKPRHLAQPGSLLVGGVDLTWRLAIIGWPMLLPDDVGQALFSQDVSWSISRFNTRGCGCRSGHICTPQTRVPG